jgi:4-amino-4-deoxy-L-arabinose transferase-like glycosyltransferase
LTTRQTSTLVFFFVFAALLVAIHLAYLKLPFHWDELGQFVPAALDLYRDGAWVPHSTVPNVHPPALMAILAMVWKITGYSIMSTRLAMLAIACLGVLFTFLLSIHLSRGLPGAPAFAAALFLIAAPVFYTQSMLAMLDMPAMTWTLLALLLFLNEQWIWCAAVCTLLALTKETAITTPAVFAAWLWFKAGKKREALYFLAPALALAGWLFVLHHATGFWLGNAEFAQYNATGTLEPFHIAAAILRRAWFLFVSDGNFIGSIALFAGWHLLKGREWTITAWVAAAQLFVIIVFGGAVLERYALPVLPLVYIAMAAAASAYPSSWRKVSHVAMVACLVAGWFWNPPYPFPFENNLAMVNFVRLQQEAADYLEAFAPTRRIASQWPFTDAITHPEFGYVQRPLRSVPLIGFSLPDLASTDRSKYDILVVYTRVWPVEGHVLDIAPVRRLLRTYFNYQAEATEEELQAGLGLVLAKSWERQGQTISVYVRTQGGNEP